MYGDYELTCGVTSMRPSSKQQDLSLQCRCHATPLRAAAGRKPRMMALCHHPQQRYSRSSGINFITYGSPTCAPLSLSFLFFLSFCPQSAEVQLIRSVTHNIVAGGRYRPTLRQGSYVTTPDCACSYRETHIRRRY